MPKPQRDIFEYIHAYIHVPLVSREAANVQGAQNQRALRFRVFLEKKTSRSKEIHHAALNCRFGDV